MDGESVASSAPLMSASSVRVLIKCRYSRLTNIPACTAVLSDCIPNTPRGLLDKCREAILVEYENSGAVFVIVLVLK